MGGKLTLADAYFLGEKNQRCRMMAGFLGVLSGIALDNWAVGASGGRSRAEARRPAATYSGRRASSWPGSVCPRPGRFSAVATFFAAGWLKSSLCLIAH